ncbi:hypothetical protein E3N88_34467 [Mikania micrantha]|uniref:Glycine-rich protein n=1 Tax=Mikania micrantha TaxID=192012 RepID=A0A5N6LY73_9ASTR|nr:hypothetical protein E3N88_34467 [Mikania micrantha]
MASKIFLLIALAFATSLLITSEIVAARELTYNNESKYLATSTNHNNEKDDHVDHVDDWHDHGDDDYYDHDRDHNHYNHGDHDWDDHGDHDWDDHDHHDHGYYFGRHRGYRHGGHGRYDYGWGHRGGYCRYGCCGDRDYYYRGCRCCATLEEAATYKQSYQAQTHN